MVVEKTSFLSASSHPAFQKYNIHELHPSSGGWSNLVPSSNPVNEKLTGIHDGTSLPSLLIRFCRKIQPSKNQKSRTPDIPKQIDGATILRQARARSVSK